MPGTKYPSWQNTWDFIFISPALALTKGLKVVEVQITLVLEQKNGSGDKEDSSSSAFNLTALPQPSKTAVAGVCSKKQSFRDVYFSNIQHL